MLGGMIVGLPGMEGELSKHAPGEGSNDICEAILSRFSESQADEHQHLCSVVGMITQELKEHDLPATPTAYFLSACSSLDRLTTSSMSVLSPDRTFDSLLIILSVALPQIPTSIITKKRDYVSDVIIRTTRIDSQSRSTSVVAAVSSLKCAAYLLSIRNSIDWNDIAPLYDVLLGYLIDSRPKVRRQCSSSLRDVLESFQGTSTLSSASEGIVKTFERFLLLAGGSHQEGVDGGPRGAREVLYMLETLKDCLPVISVKHKATVLNYYKRLLELRQPVVTRKVSDSLNTVCLQSSSDVPSELLLDLLLLLAVNASTSETSADNLTFTARLLAIGMKRVYSMNRHICVVKLPVVFSTLKDILASEHEEAILAATEALKNLIRDCVDDSLMKQGIDQINASKKQDSRISAPTIIEKLCAMVESLLDYQYSAVWDMVFLVVSALFDKLGSYSPYFTKGIMRNLADLQKLSDKDFSYRNQMHECLGAALGAMGPETFLAFFPLNLDADDLSEVNVWVFPVLKQYTVGAHLGFFVETLMSMINKLRLKSRKLELQGSIVAARSTDALVYSLWSLLPSFCNYPLDTAESFNDLESGLRIALKEQTEARGMICSALQLLINQNKKFLSDNSDLSTNDVSTAHKRALTHYTSSIAANNLNILKSSSHGLLTHLAKVFMESSTDNGGILQSTIRDLASISEKNVIKRIFTNAMRKLLEAMKTSMNDGDQSSNHSQSLERGKIYDLAAALLPGLDGNEIDVLFSAVKMGLKDSDGLIQKKAYKVLSVVLHNSSEFLQSKFEEVQHLLIDVMPLCHFSAKRHRIDCLYSLIVHALKLQDGLEQKWSHIISSFLTEVILGLVEANKKTRNRAYDVLVQIGRAFDDEKAGNKQNLFMFFNMVAGGLAGESPHMVSASVKGLARLTYEFSDLVSTAYSLLPSTYLLFQRTNRQVVKASLGLLKVLVAKSPVEGLQLHLKSMLEGLLTRRSDAKNQFKDKVKQILKMLVRKCGLESVKQVMPDEHMKLLNNIRKINERNERKQTTGSEETKSHVSMATTSRLSKWNHTRIFSDFGVDSEENDELMEQKAGLSSRRSKAASLRSRKMRASDRSLPEDLFDQMEDEPLDLLDRQKTRSILRPSERLKRKLESEDEPEIDSEGRLIVHLDERPKDKPVDPPRSSGRSEAGSHLSVPTNKYAKKRKTSDTGWAYSGREYASKKAGGDVKKANRYEPYAYWPLDRKLLSRRPKHKAAAKKGMASAVKLTKKLEGKSVSTALSMKAVRFKKNKKSSK